MDIRQIEAFHTVITYGTTARAAEVLGISQPAVSKAIMSLERAVGFKVFDREKGRLISTAEGQLFFREVEVSFAGLARLRSAAARIRYFGTGEIRVGCLSAFSVNLVPNAIARFVRRNPGIEVTLVVAGSGVVRDMVAANQLDIAVTADEIDATGVEAAPFAEIRAALACHPAIRLPRKTKSCPAIWMDFPSWRSRPKTPPAARLKRFLPATMWPPASWWKPPIPQPSARWFWRGLAAASSIR